MLDIKFIDDEKYPLEASESGDNAFYFAGCPAMARPNFASCLAKCRARKKGRLDERYSDCSALIGKRECIALKMRKEEKEKGHAIYFISRPKLTAFNEYRFRMERESWTTLQETGKRTRKPTEEFEIEKLDENAPTFNAGDIAGFTPNKSHNSGVGSYEEVEPSLDQFSYKERADEVLLPRANSAASISFGPNDSPSSILAKLITKGVEEANAAANTEVEGEAEPAPVVHKKKPRPPIEPGESPLAYARRIQAAQKEEENE